MSSKQKSLARFIYLNIYGLILLGLALIVLAIPTLNLSVLLFVLKCLLSLFLAYNGIFILSQWGEKKKHYRQLMSINRNRIKVESFESFVQTPCGRLLTRVVLSDLGKKEYYPLLKQTYLMTCRERIRRMRHPEPSVIVFSEAGKRILKEEEK